MAGSDSGEEEEPGPTASSSTVQPLDATPNVKGKEREIDVRMPLDYNTDEPPSYSRIHVENDEGTVAYAEDYLRKWHPGLRSIGGIMGGLRPSSSRNWRHFKKEINFECLVIEKVMQASSTASEVDDDDEAEVEALDEDEDPDWIPETPSMVAYPVMLMLGFGMVIFLSGTYSFSLY